MSGSSETGASLTPASSINDLRTQSLGELIRRLGRIDLSSVLLNMITGAPDSALPFLAWQFDMLSPWWQLLSGPLSQRQLIEQAVPLHRCKGTPFAIRSIATQLGFDLVTIEEGQESWGGVEWPTDQGWAVFRVVVDKARITPVAPAPSTWDAITNVDLLVDINTVQQASEIVGISVGADAQAQLADAIAFFKPERSWLDSAWFREIPVSEPRLEIFDSMTLAAGSNVVEGKFGVCSAVSTIGWAVQDRKMIKPVYDSHFYHAGISYGGNEPVVVDSGVILNP